jgi:hypothetical protein
MAENKGRTLAMLPCARNHCAKIVVVHIAPHDAPGSITHERLGETWQRVGQRPCMEQSTENRSFPTLRLFHEAERG